MKVMLRKTLSVGVGVFLVSLATAAMADPMPARETARVLPKKGVAVALASPSALGLGHGLEITTTIVPWLLLSPNASLRAELLKTRNGLVFTTEYGLGVPSGAMKLLQGYLFPSYGQTGITPPFILQQHAALWLSGGERNVWTVRADVTTGLGTNSNFAPLESYAFFNLWFGPATADSRWHLGATYDHALLDWLRGRAGFHLYALGKSVTPDRSLVYVSADAAFEARLGKRLRIALGAAIYNYDTGELDDELDDDGRWQKIRSTDIYPTLDIVYYSP